VYPTTCRLITVNNNRASAVLQPCVSCRPTEIAYGTEDNVHKHLSQCKEHTIVL